jgi:UDPglucose 6-dehydrogenase
MKANLLISTSNKMPLVQMRMFRNYSISILGSGVVGENFGRGLAEIAETVVFYDVDEQKIKKLKSAGFAVAAKLESAVMGSNISYFCVPTPATDKGEINLSYIKDITENTARALKKKQDYHLIVVKSTVLPTTTETVIIPILEKHSGKKAGRDFGVCCNPEFLTEIHNSWTDDEAFVRGFFNEPFIVIGEIDQKSGEILEDLYSSLKPPIFRTSLRTAEMLKYAFNCALATRISYWNEIFYICQKSGIDSDVIASIASHDQRVGKYGTIHKKAFGGKCLPKDLSALVSFCQKSNHNPELLKAVLNINQKISREFGVRE